MERVGIGLTAVIFRDDPVACGRGDIAVRYGVIQGVASMLAVSYPHCALNQNREGLGEYLFANGVIARTQRVVSPKRELDADQLVLIGHDRKQIRTVASDLKLPEIPESSYLRYDQL